MRKFFSLILLVLLSTACSGGPTHKEQLTSFGALGEKKVHRMDRLPSQSGSIAGGFFFGSGAFSGSTSTVMTLIFYWEPKPDQIIASQVPYSKFRIFVDEKYDQPTVEFMFNDSWLDQPANLAGSENSLYESRISDYVASEYLDYAKIHISKKTMASEIYLPK